VPHYGIIVYSPAPADPMAFAEDHMRLLDEYPAQAKALRGKVLGGSYFPKQRGFAFGPSTTAMAVQDDTVRNGTLLKSDLVVSAFFVVAAPNIDVATQIAQLHPAVRDGGVEVRPMFVPEDQVQDDYAD